jgi:hypothetical protein
MDQFLNTAETLRAISEKELSKTALSTAETLFLQQVVEGVYFGQRTYSGWYPALFYEPGSEYIPWEYYPPNEWPSDDNQGSDYWDALVTDVHPAASCMRASAMFNY